MFQNIEFYTGWSRIWSLINKGVPEYRVLHKGFFTNLYIFIQDVQEYPVLYRVFQNTRSFIYRVFKNIHVHTGCTRIYSFIHYDPEYSILYRVFNNLPFCTVCSRIYSFKQGVPEYGILYKGF